MRRSTTIATAVVGASVLLAGGGLLTRDRVEPPPAPASEDSQLIDPVATSTGMIPVEDQVALWHERSAADPADYLSRTHLGRALLWQARQTGSLDLYPEARRVFEEALAINPRHPAALLGLGAARGAEHDFAAQLDLARQALVVQPGSLSALATLGDAQLELGDYDEAASTYQQLAVEERTPPVLSRLSRLAAVRGRLDDAVALVTEAVDGAVALDLDAATVAQYRFQLGHAHYQGGDVARAAAELERALELVPTHLPSLELLARVRVAQQRPADAIAIYEDLLDRGPAADLHGAVAALYAATGRPDEATRHLEEGLRLGREAIARYPAERRHLAGFFARHDPALAVELAELDLQTRHDVYAYDVLSWAQFQAGRPHDAAVTVARALEVGTVDVELLYHAGMIAAAVGDHAGAAELLTRALAINPHFDVVEVPRAAAVLAELAAGLTRR